jgi:hypothetical protein
MRLCTVENCSNLHRARGFCTTHYNQQRPSPGLRMVETVVCAGCGSRCEKRRDPRRPRRYCSLACRTDTQYREIRSKRPGNALVYVGAAFPRPDLLDAALALPEKKPRVFVSGPCSWCGEDFTIIDQRTARYCSKRCSGKASRSRSGRFTVSDEFRLTIYERDDWVCQLCFEPVERGLPSSHAWSATLDHIVCQSWTEAPDHSAANLRLAHRWCNSKRGNEGFHRVLS